jgi:hypothetical protein
MPVEQKEIDVSVVLFGPDGQQIAETDSPNDRWGTEPVLLWLPNRRLSSGRDRQIAKSPGPPKLYCEPSEATHDKSLVAAQRVFEEVGQIRRSARRRRKARAIEKYQQALQFFESWRNHRQALTRSIVARRSAKRISQCPKIFQ